MSSSRALLLSILALSALAFAYAFQTPAVPKALSADADPRDFSGHRALLHIQNIAREPRPTGSSSLARARVYLIGALRAASPRFQIEVQDGLVVESFLPGVANATRVKNIVARLPGTNSTRTLLLLAHYDSVVNSPGANDDGAGVATALELVRSLAARGANRNDIVVLLTDGEERGMLGARAYYQQHTRGSDPAIVFNFEARGNSGPALLFQSGAKSEWLVREFARFAKSPAASSVAQELFRILPYGTDFSVFAKGGQPGLNFAYINNTIYYHSAFDTPESVDVGSLQHHGDNVLELLVHLAALDLSETPADSKLGPSPTYFLAGRELIVYSHRWNGWLLGLAWLMYLACFARGIRCGRLREFAWQLSAPLIVAAASALFVWGLWRGLVLNVHPEMTAILPTGETYRAGFFKASLQ
ncbi:MAG: M20/M25/M40 family metallo-hydrolase, partial [Leptospirales bacterium]